MTYTMENKLVVQVRYYERMYIIKDDRGERVYLGSDKKRATEVLRVLNVASRIRARKKRAKTTSRRRVLTRKIRKGRK